MKECPLPGDECNHDGGCDTCQIALERNLRERLRKADEAIDLLIEEAIVIPPQVVTYLNGRDDA